jgi:hypothetical protein
MSETPTINKKKARERIARATRQKMTALIAVLGVIASILLFRIGQDFWPAWVMKNEGLLTGLFSLVTVMLILLSPIIVEFNSNPRPLSGAGKNPQNPNSPY